MDEEQAEDDDGAVDQFHMAAHAGGDLFSYSRALCRNERKIKL